MMEIVTSLIINFFCRQRVARMPMSQARPLPCPGWSGRRASTKHLVSVLLHHGLQLATQLRQGEYAHGGQEVSEA